MYAETEGLHVETIHKNKNIYTPVSSHDLFCCYILSNYTNI